MRQQFAASARPQPGDVPGITFFNNGSPPGSLRRAATFDDRIELSTQPRLSMIAGGPSPSPSLTSSMVQSETDMVPNAHVEGKITEETSTARPTTSVCQTRASVQTASIESMADAIQTKLAGNAATTGQTMRRPSAATKKGDITKKLAATKKGDITKKPAATTTDGIRKRPAAAPDDRAKCPDTSAHHKPIHIGRCTIFCDTVNELWRVKPAPGSRRTHMLKWGARPREAWERVLLKVQELNN
jgi:hypothetical protein